jgi:hypothetical protein
LQHTRWIVGRSKTNAIPIENAGKALGTVRSDGLEKKFEEMDKITAIHGMSCGYISWMTRGSYLVNINFFEQSWYIKLWKSYKSLECPT